MLFIVPSNSMRFNQWMDTKQIALLFDAVQFHIPGDIYFAIHLTKPDVLYTLYSTPFDLPEPVLTLIRQVVSNTTTPNHYTLTPDDSAMTAFQAGCFAYSPLDTGGVIVVGVLGQAPYTYTPTDLEHIATVRQMIVQLATQAHTRALLDHHQLLTRVYDIVTTHTDIQTLVDGIHANIMSDHVTACAILLYGPHMPDENTFEYVEVAGSWTRISGSGYGLGTRIYLDENHLFLKRLTENNGILSNQEITENFSDDALLRGLFKSGLARSWVLIALHQREYKVGLCLITTDQAAFTPQQLTRYQDIATVIANGLAMHTLQRDRQVNLHGRKALLDAVHDGVLIAVPGTNGATVSLLNARFREMFNYQGAGQRIKLDDVLANMQIPPSTQRHLAAVWKSIPFQDKRVLHGDFKMMHQHGQPMDIMWYSAPMYNPENETVFARVFLFHDATPEHAAVQVRAAFLSRVSHELRTPLTAISGFSEFILEATGDDLPELAREYVEIIRNSAQHLKQVFSDLIEITRAYAGEISLHLVECDIETVVASAISALAPVLSEQRHTPLVKAEPGLPPIQLDPDRIRFALQEIIENAALYTPPSEQSITILVKSVSSLSALASDAPADILLPAIQLSILDRGTGFTVEQAKAYFEPFQRGSNAMAKQIQGTGLGLTLAQTIVDLHRGKIWIERTTDAAPGGKVHLTLPV